jgi:putative intracellular protease/amidase
VFPAGGDHEALAEADRYRSTGSSRAAHESPRRHDDLSISSRVARHITVPGNRPVNQLETETIHEQKTMQPIARMTFALSRYGSISVLAVGRMTMKLFAIRTQVLCLLGSLLCVSIAGAQSTTRIGVLLFDGILSSDATAPMEVFGAAIAHKLVKDYQVATIAPQAGIVTTHEGLKLVADYSFENAPELDVLIVGSRYDMDSLLEDAAFMAFVRDRGARAKWLASNCSGAYPLAKAGFLDGKKATTYVGGELWLKLNHPRIDIEMNKTVVVDDNVVTSNGSLVSYQAALELLRRMENDKVAEEVADKLYYTRLLEKAGREKLTGRRGPTS